MKVLVYIFSFSIAGALAFFNLFDGRKKMSPVEYVQWVEDPSNGLKAVKEVGEYNFSLQYQPLEYIVVKQKAAKEISKKELETGIGEIKDMQYYILNVFLKEGENDLLRYGLKNTSEYEERVRYFSFDIQHDLKLLDGTDTLHCLLHHFERTYSVAPYINILIAFPIGKKGKGENNKTLLYSDKVFGAGTVKITIDDKHIKKTPELITD